MSTPRRTVPSSLTEAAVSAPALRPLPAVAPAPAAASRGVRTERASAPTPIHSGALFGSSDVVLIQHAGETYRLQRTRLGKLILTK